MEDGENVLLLPLLKISTLLLLLNRVVGEYEVLLLLRRQVGVDAVVNDERQGAGGLLLLLHVGERGGRRAPWSNAVECEVVSVPVVQL